MSGNSVLVKLKTDISHGGGGEGLKKEAMQRPDNSI